MRRATRRDTTPVVVAAVAFVGTLSLGSALSPVLLQNAAQPGVYMPQVGLGTGSYANGKPSDPACWSCPNVTYNAVMSWLKAGGRRIDTALCYNTEDQIGRAIKDSGVPRSEIFITSKVASCSGAVQGFNETLAQQVQNLQLLQTTYTDLLLIHWPGPPNQNLTKDPACQAPDLDGRWGSCRRATWRAMLKLLADGKNGGSLAVGVSNFEKDHLMDLMPVAGARGMPSVNQMEVHPWWHDDTLIPLHQSLGIVGNGYAPFAAPDFIGSKWNVSIKEDPTLTKVALATGMSNWQVTLRWQLQKGWLVNPRTATASHQQDDLAVASDTFTPLSSAHMAEIDAIHPIPRVPPIHKVCPDPATRL